MKKVDALRLFKSMLPIGKWFDYWTLQEMWSYFIDSLCKDGAITAHQWKTWGNQSKEGKTAMVTNDGRWVYKK